MVLQYVEKKFSISWLRQPSPGSRRLWVIEEFYSYAGFVGMSQISPFLLEFPEILPAPG
jgi:hypothetical protein